MNRKRHFVVDLSRPKQRALVAFFLIAGIIELGLLAFGGLETLEFTDSPQFCGALCHQVMEPEWITYQTSPHAEVPCAECHVGSGTNYLVRSKATGIPLIFATIFDTFDRPVQTPVHSLRPARETCENCHWPEKFTEDRVRIYQRFAPDEQNTKQAQVLMFRMGRGTAAGGVHWHIANDLWYLPLDKKRQEIAWVQVRTADGTVKEFVNPARASEVTPERIESDKRFFDCVDCHNRATHVFKSPDQLLDAAMARGDIDPTLPFIKREGLRVLDIKQTSLEAARAQAETLRDYYRKVYPDLYAKKPQEIDTAVATLKALVAQVIFPKMEVTYETHTQNLSHEGCFRCHGVLVPKEAAAEAKPLTASCTLCHFELPASTVTAFLSDEPGSLLARGIPHPVKGAEACLECHKDGMLGATLIPPTHAGRTSGTCLDCHRELPRPTPTPTPTPRPTPTPTPTQALTPTSTAPAPQPTATPTPTPAVQAGPSIPHTLESRTSCLLCHEQGVLGAKKAPQNHTGRTNETCQQCHAPKS